MEVAIVRIGVIGDALDFYLLPRAVQRPVGEHVDMFEPLLFVMP